MKKLFTIADSTENRISFWHLAVFLVLLPLDRYISQLVLISFMAHSLIHINKEGISRLLHADNLMLSSVWLLTICGLIYSHDRSQGFRDALLQLGIAGFPFMLSITKLNPEKYRTALLAIFGFTCVAAVLFIFTDALAIIYYYGLPTKTLFSYSFVNQNFSSPLGIHATYLSIFLALSAIIFLQLSVKEKNRLRLVIYIICILILLAGLMQLASRAVLIAMMIFILLPLPWLFVPNKNRLKVFLITLAFSVVSVFIITRVDVFRKRYISELKDDLKMVSLNKQIPEPRLLRWEAAMELVRKSPLVGYGSGSEKRILKEKYYEKKLYTSYLLELNTHNQYLAIWLKTGVAGLIVFIFTLFYGFRLAWRNRDTVFTCFMLLVTVVAFSENILEVNKGVFFYAFFFSFLAKSGKPFDYLMRSGKKIRNCD